MKKLMAALALLALSATGQAWAQAHDYITEVDTNHDGAIQRAEMDAMQADHFNLQDHDGNGQLDAAEARAGGAVSREQYQAQALATFDSVDADHDGALTGDEITALHNLVSGVRQAAHHP